MLLVEDLVNPLSLVEFPLHIEQRLRKRFITKLKHQEDVLLLLSRVYHLAYMRDTFKSGVGGVGCAVGLEDLLVELEFALGALQIPQQSVVFRKLLDCYFFLIFHAKPN